MNKYASLLNIFYAMFIQTTWKKELGNCSWKVGLVEINHMSCPQVLAMCLRSHYWSDLLITSYISFSLYERWLQGNDFRHSNIPQDFLACFCFFFSLPMSSYISFQHSSPWPLLPSSLPRSSPHPLPTRPLSPTYRLLFFPLWVTQTSQALEVIHA